MNQPTTKCSHCERELDENDFCTFDKDGNDVCESCESDAWNYANSVITIHGEDKKSYLWCEAFGFREREYFEEESPNGVDGFKYVRTDAWRGYWDVEIAHGYTTLASGWATGSYSDVPWKHAFNDLVDRIQEGELQPPVELIFAFGLTSNVFSTSTDVIVRECDLKTLTMWLTLVAGISIEELEQALK